MSTLEKLREIEDHGEGLTLLEARLVCELLADGLVRFSPLQEAAINAIHGERVPR